LVLLVECGLKVRTPSSKLIAVLIGNIMNRNTIFRIACLFLFVALSATSLLAQPGDFDFTEQIGATYPIIQHSKSMGKTIAFDDEEGVHFTYTKLFEDGRQHVVYNFFDISGVLYRPDENPIVDPFENSTQATLLLAPDLDEQRAAISYSVNDVSYLGVDFARGFGAFSNNNEFQYGIESRGGLSRSHNLFYTVNVPFPDEIGFTLNLIRGVFDRRLEDYQWRVGEPRIIDSTIIASQVIATSAESNRVAVIWHKNLTGFPTPEEWHGTIANEMNNDIYALICEDGQNWEMGNLVNITKTVKPVAISLTHRAVTEGSCGDTLRPYPDIDAIWVDDILHVVFTTKGFKADLTGEAVPPVEWISTNESLIWHWDSESDTLTLVADGWYENNTQVSALGGNVSKPSLAADRDGVIYCIYRQAIPEDTLDGYCAADIMVTSSADGIEWSEPMNVTNTHVFDNEDEPVNELYPSVAENAGNFMEDTKLHLMYVLGWADGSGVAPQRRDNRVMYHQISVELIAERDLITMPREGFQYHNYPPYQVVRDLEVAPGALGLHEVYPNPFNGITNIEFEIDGIQDIDIAVFDQQGRLVASLLSGNLSTGRHEVVWDASEVGAGIYWIRLTSGENILTRKVVLVK